MTTTSIKVPFNKAYLSGKEIEYVTDAINRRHIAGNGDYTKKCESLLEEITKSKKALLVHSCTAALEMSAILLNIEPGDEVIMPSYTFVSTANAFVLRGAVPVFVDIRPDTLNIDETQIEGAITKKTKAIVVVHYAGVGCEMTPIMDIAKRHNLFVVEDNAQGLMSTYEGKPLGSFGHLATLSFHETKNLVSGEGGALLINDPDLIERAEIIREKGTDRSKFFRGQIDKYTWKDIGSSYLPGEIISAFLLAQLEHAKELTTARLAIWERYDKVFRSISNHGNRRCPMIPNNVQHNAHIYYLLLQDQNEREYFIEQLKLENIYAVFHYVPLHLAPAGLKFGRAFGDLPNTINLSNRLVRLPIWVGIEKHLDEVIYKSTSVLNKLMSDIEIVLPA